MKPTVLSWFLLSLLYLGGIVAQQTQNFGRMKREILTEILEMTDSIERERRDADSGNHQQSHHHTAHPGPAHHVPSHHVPAHHEPARHVPAHHKPANQGHDHSRREAENPHQSHMDGHDQSGHDENSGHEHTEHEQPAHEQSGRDHSEHEHHGKDFQHEHPGKDFQHEHHGKDSQHEHHGRDPQREHHGRDSEHEHHGKDSEHEHHGKDSEHEHHGKDSQHEHHGKDSQHEHHGKDSQHEHHGKESQHEHHGIDTHDERHGKDKREAQVQNCVGSQCNQNNIATGFFPFSQSIAQNCVGSACNQNNFGRKKRALIQAFIDDAEKIKEEDLEAGEHHTENPYENISGIIDEVYKIESEKDTKAEDDQSDNIPTVRKEESSLIRFLLREIFIIPKIKLDKSPPVHTLNCHGPTGSKCSSGICTVACSDGAKVQLHCPSNSMVVKNTAVGQLINRAEVSCGGVGEDRNDYSNAINGFY